MPLRAGLGHFHGRNQPRPQFGKSPFEHKREGLGPEPGEVAQDNPDHESCDHKDDRRDGRRLAEPPRQLQGRNPKIGPIQGKREPKEDAANDAQQGRPFEQNIGPNSPSQAGQDGVDRRPSAALGSVRGLGD
jgi:hypothetical protein